jgi:gliding motility-associated-like protein
VNDFFEVFSTAVKLFEIKIFNRWGEKVFESDNIQKGWDGYFLGEQAQAGVYVYELSVTYLNNKTEKRRGSLSLIK